MPSLNRLMQLDLNHQIKHAIMQHYSNVDYSQVVSLEIATVLKFIGTQLN